MIQLTNRHLIILLIYRNPMSDICRRQRFSVMKMLYKKKKKSSKTFFTLFQIFQHASFSSPVEKDEKKTMI